MARMFIGIDIPIKNKKEILLYCHGPRNIQWVDYQNFHLNLCFLGEIDRRSQNVLESSLDEMYLNQFHLNPEGIGSFDKSQREKIIWIGIKLSPELIELQRSIDKNLSILGISRDKRKFIPHITIGKMKNAKKEDLNQYLQQEMDYPLSDFQVTSFSLFSSKLRPQGPLYRIEREFQLYH